MCERVSLIPGFQYQ